MNFLKLPKASLIIKKSCFSDFLAITHILDKKAEFKTYSSKLRSSGFISNSVLEYNRNILRSVSESKAYIITNGWEDTYPLLTLLEEEKKKNIRVINVEWLYDENFRNQLMTDNGTGDIGFQNNPYSWIKSFVSRSSSVLYFTPTLPNSELLNMSDSITPMGILFKSGSETAEIQNYECLQAWKKFSKIHISSTESISKNYIILLTLLENTLPLVPKEKETLNQVIQFKAQLETAHPSLK